MQSAKTFLWIFFSFGMLNISNAQISEIEESMFDESDFIFDAWDEQSARFGVGSILTSNKFYPELNINWNIGGFGVGVATGKIFGKQKFNETNNLGWFLGFSIFSKINLIESRKIQFRPGISINNHFLSVFEGKNKLLVHSFSGFCAIDIIVFGNFGFEYQIESSLKSWSGDSNTSISSDFLVHKISLIYELQVD